MAVGQIASRPCTVVLHDDRISPDDVLCGSKVLPLDTLAFISSQGANDLCFVAKKAAAADDEISIHVSLAARFGFDNRKKGMVYVIEDASDNTATHVELFFREQHLSRADMWRIMQQLNGTVVYHGQNVKYLGSPVAEVRAIYIDGQGVQSGYVTQASTKPIFRSGSARFTLLIQVSKEMLEYWDDAGNLMFERLLSGYLPGLFRKWDAMKVRHQVSVVLFGNSSAAEARHDFSHVVASDVPSNRWQEIVRRLKREFNSPTLPKQVSLATKGNMLQSIHMAAMTYANDHVDPHLSSAGGMSIIAITAGTGLFETNHQLLKSTTHLLMGNSIGVDIVSLSPKPLHPVPLFSYERNEAREYALPHWVDISFWGGQRSGYSSRWVLPETVRDVNDIAIPLLKDSGIHDGSDTALARTYDDSVFDLGTNEAPISDYKIDKIEDPRRSLDTVPGDRDIVSHAGNGEATPKVETVQTLPLTNNGSVKRPKTDSGPPHSLMASGRKISLGPKGLAPGRSLASTSISAEHAQQEKDILSHVPFTSDQPSGGIAKQIRQSLVRKPSQQSLSSQTTVQNLDLASRPINIRNGQTPHGEQSAGDVSDPASLIEQNVLATVSESEIAGDVGMSETPKAKRDPFWTAVRAAEEEGHWAECPWVTLLNPCNPNRGNMRVAAQYRKWQHVFPKAVSSGVFKWASMCSPAALPLTTEYRPSLRELERKFTKKVRRLLVEATDSNQVAIDHSIQQLVLLRLAHGFQISPDGLQEFGGGRSFGDVRLLLSLGNLHHELKRLSPTEIQIVEYSPEDESTEELSAVRDEATHYRARIRSDIDDRSRKVNIDLGTAHHKPDWSALDDQILAEDVSRVGQTGSRMRLVLIPVEPPRTTQTALRELSDEERRIDGIQKLTQLWQRQRYFTAEGQRHQATLVRSPAARDRTESEFNPLAIEYQTRDPSAVVNAYGPALSGELSGDEQMPPLFPESELYHSSTFDVSKLVKQMQEAPPLGVEVRDRRWMTRLHFKCFRGDEMVNWLMRVFKDLHTRDEAVAIGNELMSRGVFAHVRHKHEFRDGHYFYQITSAYRSTEYPDTVSMFAKGSMRSVPSTPTAESRSSPMLRPFHGDSESIGRETPKQTPTVLPADKRQILLSQMMLYNVDPSRKSNQTEIISLHYDRIHNPANVYHIQLEWINATAKLIRDAVGRWSSLVESHGLRLVQIPLTEVCKLSAESPFNQPVPVKLAVRPPQHILATPVLDPHTFGPRVSEDSLAYQKAVLRKSEFVLDYEAASSFTTKLDVQYSFGRPKYDLTQFIHKSGLVLAQISSDHKSDFLLLPNPLASQFTSSSIKRGDTEDLTSIMRHFIGFCSDETALTAFYEDANKPRIPPPSPFSPSTYNLDNDVPPMQLPPHLTHRAALRGL